MYNLGIHSFNTGIGHMYVWNETQGGRGSQDISSIVRKHLIHYASTHKHIVLYSDACGGQNRNIKMALTLLKLVQSSEIQADMTDLKFMVSGHSYLPNYREFGIIEAASKRKEFIYSPDDWIDIITRAKRKIPPFQVEEIKFTDFLSTKSLEDAVTNRKKDINGDNFSWLNIQWLRVIRGYKLLLHFKQSLSEVEDFRQINLEKTRQRGRQLLCLSSIIQAPLYSYCRPVTADKKKDMTDLLPYIPQVHHSFYKYLPVETGTRLQNQPNQEQDVDGEISFNDEFVYD